MGISSINMVMGASWGAYNQKLTQATRDRLESLGIPFNSNISEEEGKKLLKTYEAAKNEITKEKNSSSSNQSSSDLFEKAKKLAEKIGIQVSEGINFQQLLMVIQAKLEEKISTNSNDINALKELKGLSQELAFIQAQSNGSSGYDNTNQALMTSLDY